MVLPTEIPPINQSSVLIDLKKRTTSSIEAKEDPMNTAFYEPEDFEAEIELCISKRTIQEKKSDYWEDKLDSFNKKHPFLMLHFAPVVFQLFLIALTTLFLNKAGVTDSIDKLAAHLYYFLFCVIF
ncbi:ABC2_membrane domain-containing protein [Caenorhabditis elegans]|uniref:ABC2_membrane domain-containing protein n=1 Tax=Caenorhabditis elegans TaxID=6239 RepID=Q93229_CAEEL|nr:ABC2_membrane domain-containing protein [Caenorhabditis elegans]CAB02746.1 ABC2_membrane domain-containing protein [Caenorhabditis elegans]|eukprot:NP_492503.1 Uncharacterized protein CELE_C17E4.4 [Caenorhabditis elegans]